MGRERGGVAVVVAGQKAPVPTATPPTRCGLCLVSAPQFKKFHRPTCPPRHEQAGGKRKPKQEKSALQPRARIGGQFAAIMGVGPVSLPPWLRNPTAEQSLVLSATSKAFPGQEFTYPLPGLLRSTYAWRFPSWRACANGAGGAFPPPQ